MKSGEYYIIGSWLDVAVRKIKYGPDRKRVRRELASHLEDAMSAYMDSGYEMHEAAAMAVKNMGDAGEIADELGAIHKPYFSYFCNFMVILALLFILVFGRSEQLDINGKNYAMKHENANVETLFDGTDGPVIEQDSRVKVGEYDIYIDKAAIVDYNSGNQTVKIKMNIETDKLSYMKPQFFRYITVEDEGGNVYRLEQDTSKDGLRFMTNYGDITGKSEIAVYFNALDKNAKNYTVKYDRAGVRFELPVKLGE
ncbi:MAG: hypothetical protein E7432_04920 [Ruminococcaceae bacterium]|nr:hypothetical protein [Oscillospiraceae bacterium]